MRTAIVGFVLIAVAGAGGAQPDEYTSITGKFSAKFPGTPKVASQVAKTAVGELKVTTVTYATADGGVYMVSFTDFPPTATKPENHATLLDGIRDGVLGREGKLLGEEKSVKFGPDKLPGRELTVDKEKAKQRIKYRVVIRAARVYQVAAIGTPEFAGGADATAFLESFELTQ